MERVTGKGKGSKAGMIKAGLEAAFRQDEGVNSRVAMIQMLIPFAINAVKEELLGEVETLVGQRYSREQAGVKRWGSNPGSVYLGNQKASLSVPRVRDVLAGCEVPLSTYKAFQDTGVIDNAVLGTVLNGISQRKYEKAATLVPQTFGIRHSSVSRRFVKAAVGKLKEFLERDLNGEDIVAVFVDGKRFAKHGIVVALGVRIDGKKTPLGFIESSVENQVVCGDFVRNLVERGLKADDGILFVVDGSKGLYKGIKSAIGENAFVQRCQWHKRENMVAYPDKKVQGYFRKKLQLAYEEPDYEKAKSRLTAVRKELSLVNESAATSLDEGFEETLTLHKPGLFKELGRSFKTTNCLESVNRGIGMYNDRVSNWKNGNQRQRWVATALMEIKPRLNRVNGHKHLKELKEAMKRVLLKRKSGKVGKAA